MGQFPSAAESAQTPLNSGLSTFSRPSFLLPFFQQQQKSKQFWLEDTDRKDFETFVQHIFSYQTTDGTLNLPENYSQSTFDSLIQSLMKQLDKYLEFQSVFEGIDKSVVPYIENSFTPKKIIKYLNFVPEKTQPFIDFVLQLYNDLVSSKPTPENIDIFLKLFGQFSSNTEVYSPLMTSLLPHITSILLLDNDSSQKLCQILISQLNSQYSSIYYVMALVDAILIMPSLSVRITLEPKLNIIDPFKPVNENIVTMRARLGENAIVQTACHYGQQSFILRNDNTLYKVSTRSVKLVKLDKITSPARLAVNRKYLFVFQCPSFIDIYEIRSHMTKKECLGYTTPNFHDLVTVCTHGEKELFLLFRQTNSDIYTIEYLNSTQITVGTLKFKKPPICMSVSHDLLEIATATKLYYYEIDFDNFKIAPMLPSILNIPNGWKLLSMQEDTFLAMKPARSHLQLAYLRQTSPLSFLPRYSEPELPEINGSLLPKDVISLLINDLVLKLSGIVWRMILEHSLSLPDMVSYVFDDNFIPFLVDIVKKSLNTLESNTLIHVTFVVLALVLIHFNDEHQMEEKIIDRILDLLTIVAKSPQIVGKTDLLLTIFLIIDHGFNHLFANSPEKLIEIAKSICSSQQIKEQFALFIPLLVASPAILYLLDTDIIKILHENTSPYTTCFVIQNSFAMLVAEYMRCKEKNMDTTRLIMTLKIITESMRDYFPKELVLMQFTFFLHSLDEMKLTSLIVSFFEFLQPTIALFDKKFEPEKIISTGKNDDDLITEQTIETKHPVGNDNKYCWDIAFPGAAAMEVEFDPSCSILIDDQDVFQILGGCSATSPIVYEKEPKSTEPFPRKLLINSNCARVIFRSFAGYHLHGLKMIFRRIDNASKDNDKIIDSIQFYLYYFFHSLGNCISTVFQEQTENPKMNCCQFMLWMKKIDYPNSLTKSQARMVPDTFMDMMACEVKATQRIKATAEIQEIETLCVSAALNQLEFTETVLSSKKFLEDPGNLRATTRKMSTLMIPRSPFPSNNKRPPRPTIVVPTNNNTNHANTIMRQSLMTPKEKAPPISQTTSGMNTNDKVNSFLKVLWKLIYQMRTRIHFAKQKSKTQYDTQLQTIRAKAKYFATVRSVFEPVNNSDSIEVLTTRANQILRVISADFSLNEMFSFVNDHIEFQTNQAGMIKQLEKFAHHITHQHLLMQIFYPLCKRLMGTTKISIPASTASSFKVLFQSLSKHFMQIDSQPDNSFQLMTLLSNFALVGFNESQSDAVFAAIKGFIAHNQNTVAWQLFIHYCMNVSTRLFEDKAKYFFESGIVGPTLLLQTLLILGKGDTVKNPSFVSSFINSKQPHMIRSIFLFLAAYFAKSGTQEEFSVKVGNITMEEDAFFRYLLKIIGEKASGKLVEMLPKDMPSESHMLVYSEITSFFRICIKKTSKVSEFLLRLFDTILLDYSKGKYDESVIGIFIVLGEGFFSSKANDYAIHDKSSAVMKLEEFSPYVRQAKLKSLLDNSVIQIDKKRIIGYPRIPPSPSDFPMTKFRANILTNMVQNYAKVDKVLFAAMTMYLNILLQDANSAKMLATPEFLNSLLAIANLPSFEGQYHSIPELIEAASQFDLSSSQEDGKLERLVKLNNNVKVGNALIDCESFYFEFSILEDLKSTNLMVGIISDDSCSEYHSFVALDLQKKAVVLNGIIIKGTEIPINFIERSAIGCLFSNNSVSFAFNDKFIQTRIPFKCRRYTPVVISSNSEIKYKINFGSSKFEYKVPTHRSDLEITEIRISHSSEPKPSNSNSLEDDDYLKFLGQNSTSSVKLDDESLSFECIKFPKPYFAHHKEIFESKIEVSPYLQNIKGQPFIVNSKLDPFNKKIGTLAQIGKDGKFQLSILDIEIGKSHVISFDEAFLERINFHYFPIKSTSNIFSTLSVRAIRYSVLILINSFENLPKSIDDSLISDYLSKMLCELIPYKKKYKTYESSKGSDTIFASTLLFNSIISISVFRNYLLKFVNDISTTRTPIIDQLFSLLVMKVKRLNSPENHMSEFNFLIETSHPMCYSRVDRTIVSPESTWFLIIPDPSFNVKGRGLLVKGSVNPFLVRKASDVESLVVGSSLQLNLSNNKPTTQFGARLYVMPQFIYSSDSTFQPISWLIHFGTALLELTANKVLPKITSDVLIPLLLHNENKILKLFRFQFLSPILFSSQPLDNEKLFELCLPLFRKFEGKFSILSITAQEDAITLVSAFMRLHAQKFKEISADQKKPTNKITSSNLKDAFNFSQFRSLMKCGQDFMKSLGHKRLEFIAYLLPFISVDTICPYFIFYNHYFSDIRSRIIIETPHPMTKSNYLYHLRFEGSPHQKVKISEKTILANNMTINFSSPKDPSLSIELKASGEPITRFPVHSDDFFVEINNRSDAKPKPWGVKMKIEPIVDNSRFPPQLIAQNLQKFLANIKLMNSYWLPSHDILLNPHIKSSNKISVIPPTSLIKLNQFPEKLIICRFSFIKQLNELFNGEVGQLPLNDVSQPLVSLLIRASSAFSSAMKLSRLEKIICKNFCQKKSFSFNRSRALLAKSNPESPEAKSLFEQVIDQIPTSGLAALKCKDAPWRVTLEGEGATDVGGPGRDLFTEVSSELCMPHNHLFIKTPRAISDPLIEEYVPDPKCSKSERFVYVGAFVALAFVTRLQQPYRFADLIWSFLAGRKVTLEQIYTIDPSLKTTITAAKKGTIEDMKYTIKNIYGEDVELIPDGATITVQPNDLNRYCDIAIQYRVNEFNSQLKKMKEGFSVFLGDICSQMVTPEELKSYICGSVDIPIQELRQLIQTTNATPEEEEMLYEVLEEFTVEERMLFIKFATGKMSVPAPGASWNGSLNVEFVKLKPKKPPYRLPLAATCSSTVSIPRYPTKEILSEKLRTAITYGSDIVLDHAFDAGGIIE